MKTIIVLVLIGLMNSYHYRHKSQKQKQQSKHKQQKQRKKEQHNGNGNILVSSNSESLKKSGVDQEPWHYKMMSPEVMYQSKNISNNMPESYNQIPDDPSTKGCSNVTLQFLNKLQEKGEITPTPPKPRIYSKDPHAYYDPTEMLKLAIGHKDVYAVPVVMEGTVENDDSRAVEAERKALHYPNSNYYDPEVLSHMYEVEGQLNGLHRPLNKYQGQVVTKDRQTKRYDDTIEDQWLQEVVERQWRMPHKQDIPIKQIRAVDMRIQDQSNRVLQQKLRAEVLPDKRANTPPYTLN